MPPEDTATQDQTQQQAPPKKSTRSSDGDNLGERVKQLESMLQAEQKAKDDLQRQELNALEERLATERVERARAQARVQFPSADQELLGEYPSNDPDAILTYAQKLHEKAQMRLIGANGVPLPPSNQTDAALSAQESQIRRWQTQIRNNHLRKGIDPIEAEQAFETFFANGWNSHMNERRRLGGHFVPTTPGSS